MHPPLRVVEEVLANGLISETEMSPSHLAAKLTDQNGPEEIQIFRVVIENAFLYAIRGPFILETDPCHQAAWGEKPRTFRPLPPEFQILLPCGMAQVVAVDRYVLEDERTGTEAGAARS